MEQAQTIHRLKTILKEELILHCDTMTVEEKLREKILNDYAQRVQQQTEKIKDKYRKEKDDFDLKSYQDKEDSSLLLWDKYAEARYQYLIAFSTEDPSVFFEYILNDFWYNNQAKYSQGRWQEKNEIARLPTVKTFLDKNDSAYTSYKKQDKEVEKKYQKIRKDNEDNYNAKRDSIQKECQHLIQKKKLELGF